MRRWGYNTGYFFKEMLTTLRMDKLSNLFSLFCTILVFFILCMVIAGWQVSSRVVEALQKEAEISVYYSEGLADNEKMMLMDKMKEIDGIREVKWVSEQQAYQQMEEILGKEAAVMKYFDDNPFSPFIEVRIELDKMDKVLEAIAKLTGVEHVRDNREVLDRLRGIAGAVKLLGLVVAIAIGASTLVIISHIIRQGIYSNKEQITTLRLLGAPESFIATPFVMGGLVLTVAGGMGASLLAGVALKFLYTRLAGPLPFIPLPPLGGVLASMFLILAVSSVILGIAGSFFGLTSARR